MHGALEQHGSKCQETHALVMGHVVVDDGVVGAFGHTLRRVVDGVVVAVAAPEPFGVERVPEIYGLTGAGLIVLWFVARRLIAGRN